MKKNMGKFMKPFAVIMAVSTSLVGISFAIPQIVSADAVEKPYLSLGADLSSEEKSTVLRLLDVDAEDLEDYELVTVTNQDEHDYLDNYLSSSVIGSRALSSVLIEKKSDGNGIHVKTKNITYCTEGMYQSALSTAGITDADVTVAGPFNITGTAALVGAMMAYEDMTGEAIDSETKDTATNELVVTGSLAEELGDSDEAEKLIAMLKEYVAEKDLSDADSINDAIDECEKELNIQLTEEQQEQINELMQKISNIDINVDELKEQAKEIYDKLGNLHIEIDSKGFFDMIKEFIQ